MKLVLNSLRIVKREGKECPWFEWWWDKADCWKLLTLPLLANYRVGCRSSTSSGYCCRSLSHRRREVFLLLSECILHLKQVMDGFLIKTIMRKDRNQMKPCTTFTTTVGQTIRVTVTLVFTLTNHSSDSCIHPNRKVVKTMETIRYGVIARTHYFNRVQPAAIQPSNN